ncbi:ribbon-helix-helix protein, CopG family [Candidatus Nanohalobium constans]|uniref:Transcriptional regulator like protein n=1 Tax=Candidatus Nanohalobium constans TaxID=2565781 RepID=A0A5Q0UGF7_9ARCH|nr:ribbon-helix-helix protein, CopG family [Candidatus Nanohalobium constans]QGA80035.1 transcriptional regulator like protein [Candidatus Nanohalobium constans]
MTLSVEVPDGMRKDLEKKKEEEYYSSMSEVVREAIRGYLKEDNKGKNLTKKEEAILELTEQGKIEKVELEGEAENKIKKRLKQVEKN